MMMPSPTRASRSSGMKIVWLLLRFVVVVVASQRKLMLVFAVATVIVQQKNEPVGTVIFDAGEKVGAISWVGSFVLLGYYFGNRPYVKKNFTMVIVAIVVISVLPSVIEIIRRKRRSDKRSTPPTV